MYGRGHEQGTKTVTRTSQSWYDELAEANIARVEAEQAALSALTAAAKDALPGQEARIDKGAALVAAHAVWPLTSGSYLVASQSDAQAAYLVQRPSTRNKEHGGQGWTCECKAFTFMGGACKHVLASMLTVRMGTTYEPRYT